MFLCLTGDLSLNRMHHSCKCHVCIKRWQWPAKSIGLLQRYELGFKLSFSFGLSSSNIIYGLISITSATLNQNYMCSDLPWCVTLYCVTLKCILTGWQPSLGRTSWRVTMNPTCWSINPVNNYGSVAFPSPTGLDPQLCILVLVVQLRRGEPASYWSVTCWLNLTWVHRNRKLFPVRIFTELMLALNDSLIYILSVQEIASMQYWENIGMDNFLGNLPLE
jgi:hypothetical protein